MAERPFAQSFDLDSEEWSGDSDSETDSDYELERQAISEAVPLIKSEGATQIDQVHAIATHRKLIKDDNRQIINVNVTANIYLHDGLPALTAEQHKELASNNNASGHTNNLNFDLGQYGSVQISLPVSSPAKATSKCSCMLAEVQSQDIQNLPDAVRRASSERKLLKYSDVSQSVSELQAEGDSSKKTGNSNSKSRTSDNQPSGVNTETMQTDISFTKISDERFIKHPRTDPIDSEEAQATQHSNKTTGAWICTREGVIYPPQIDGSDIAKAVLITRVFPPIHSDKAKQTFVKILDVEESDSESDSELEGGETVTHVQAEGATQIGQGNSIVISNNTNNNDIVQNINVNVTANVYIQDGRPPITMKRTQNVIATQDSSHQTNSLNLDLGQLGSVQIPLPVSSTEEARAVGSDALSESQSQDLITLSYPVKNELPETNTLQAKSPNTEQKNPDTKVTGPDIETRSSKRRSVLLIDPFEYSISTIEVAFVVTFKLLEAVVKETTPSTGRRRQEGCSRESDRHGPNWSLIVRLVGALVTRSQPWLAFDRLR